MDQKEICLCCLLNMKICMINLKLVFHNLEKKHFHLTMNLKYLKPSNVNSLLKKIPFDIDETDKTNHGQKRDMVKVNSM